MKAFAVRSALVLGLLCGVVRVASAEVSAGAAPSAPSSPSPSLPEGHPPQSQHMGGLFGPASDGAVDDPALAPGNLAVTIVDANGRTLPGMEVSLATIHSSVAKGESRTEARRATNGMGSAQFEVPPGDSGTQYLVSTKKAGGTFSYGPFQLSKGVGKRVTLRAFETSTRLDGLALATQEVVYLSLKEDSIQVDQLIAVLNVGNVAWLADVTIPLPRGFRGLNVEAAPTNGRVEEVPGKGVALRGTFGPGRHELTFRYRVVRDGGETQSLMVGLSPRVMQARVMAESSRQMGLEVAGFPPAQRADLEGRPLLVTGAEGRISGNDLLDVKITGLPTQGLGRWLAILIGVLTVGGGVAYRVLLRPNPGATSEEEIRELERAREEVLADIVALEQARSSGKIGDNSYKRLRASLMEALTRILTTLEASNSKKDAFVPEVGHAAAASGPKPRGASNTTG